MNIKISFCFIHENLKLFVEELKEVVEAKKFFFDLLNAILIIYSSPYFTGFNFSQTNILRNKVNHKWVLEENFEENLL